MATLYGAFAKLKDKNGKEIYEGDVLQRFYEDGDKRGEPHVVMWKDFSDCCVEGVGLSCLLACDGVYFVKVIGNIHENPELLGPMP